ncbi:photosystem II protein Y [Synechococcus sp. C9]
MDWRIALVLGPVVVAASWAAFNIAGAALQQWQRMNRKA